MSGNISNLGVVSFPGNKNDAAKARHGRAKGWMKHPRGLLMVLALGVMLACGTAYASEPSSPAPVAATKSTVNPPASRYNPDVNADLGDELFDWGIALCIIILGALVSIQFWDSREKNKE